MVFKSTQILKTKSTKRRKRYYAIRKPRDWEVSRPGDLVQIDTLNIRPLSGLVLKQFTAMDLISKWDVVEARNRATSHTARKFLDNLD